MKPKIIIAIFFFIIPFCIIAQKSDAVIIINNEEYEYSYESGNTLSETKTIYRKIKINSEYALEKLNRFYIPTFEDFDFSFNLISLEASTIKKDGTIHKVTKEEIKESTLPANTPFLYGYDGSVKMFAFTNLEVGDQIEYKYIVNYRTSSSYDYLNFIRTKFLTQEYPIESATYSFHLKTDLQFKVYSNNTNISFSETIINRKEKSYSVTLKNISENEIDQFASAYDFPFFHYRVYKKNNCDPATNWNDFIDNITFKAKRNESFFNGKSIQEIKNTAWEKNGVINQVNSIRDQISEYYKADIYYLFAQYKYFEPDLYEANQLLRLFELLDIKSSLILVKSKFNGSIIDDYISVEQFDDFLIEFHDERGKRHYLYFFAPFYETDEIPFQYQGTKALKIAKADGNYNFSFTEIPEQEPSANSRIKEYNYTLQSADSLLIFKGEVKIVANGIYNQLMRMDLMIEQLDTTSTLNFFSDNVKDDFLDNYYEVHLDTVIIEKYSGDIKYSVEFNMSKRNYNPEELLTFNVGEFIDMESILYEHEKMYRTSKAYFNFPYTKKIVLNIKTSDTYSFIDNNLLSLNHSNEVASIKANHKLVDDKLEIVIEFSLLKSECSVTEWLSFININQELENYLKSKIMLTRRTH